MRTFIIGAQRRSRYDRRRPLKLPVRDGSQVPHDGDEESKQS
nr:hypothetical protein [uncultured Porphyromonas sp.]